MTYGLYDLTRKNRYFLSVIFIAIFSLLIFDVTEDLFSGASISHVLIESVILLLSIIGLLVLWIQNFKFVEKNRSLNHSLVKTQEDLKRYKEETKLLSKGISEKIDQQFGIWELSSAEIDISLLILKGLSNKEIAEIRGTSEKTIRQQITSIFNKSGLSSRLELSAFFLEDLLIISE